MVNKILNEYIKLFSFKNLYLKFFKKSILLIYAALGLLTLVALIFYLFQHELWWIFILSCLPLLLIIPTFNREIKRIIYTEHKCKDKEEFNNLLKNKFEEILKENDIDIHNLDQLDHFINLINLTLDELRPSLYVKSGIIAGVFGPVWIGYTDVAFSFSKNLLEATLWFFSFIVTIMFVFGLFLMFKYGIVDDILHSDYYRMKSLRNKLRDYRLVNTKPIIKGQKTIAG